MQLIKFLILLHHSRIINAAKVAKTTKEITMTKEFNPQQKAKVKKFFKLRGSIKACAETQNIHRTTVARIAEIGKGDGETVDKIIAFVNDNSAA